MLAARLPAILPPLDAGGSARSVDGRLGRGRARRRRLTAPARSARRTIRPRWRRWSAAACGRGRARSRSRITACCSSTNCRNSSAQVLDSLRQPLETGEVADRARQPPRHLSGALPAGRGDEPVPLRPSRRCRATPAARRRTLRRRLSGAAVRAAARPHRPAYRGRRRSAPPT